ncbi:MAG TPA: hypothetical protein VGW34_03860 [Allosphingosinicella sp.]|nr:hypothetical protein [Allosphingosinicella sp.]
MFSLGLGYDTARPPAAAGGGGDFGPELIGDPNTTDAQAVAITEGKIYRVGWTLVSNSTGAPVPTLGGVPGTQQTVPGAYAEYMVAGGAGAGFVFVTPGDAVVSGVSVKEVLEQDDLDNELWPQPAFDASAGLTLNNCSVAGGKLLFEAAGALMRARLTSPTLLAAGDILRGAITIDSNDGTDEVLFMLAGTTRTFETATGAFSVNVRVSASSQSLEVRGPADTTAQVDNVSIRQVILPPL